MIDYNNVVRLGEISGFQIYLDTQLEKEDYNIVNKSIVGGSDSLDFYKILIDNVKNSRVSEDLDFIKNLNGIINGLRDNDKFDVSKISDGYHTFEELYDYRVIYNAMAFNQFYDAGLYDVHKSTRHYDGELCFGGDWFVVVAMLPSGQITNHYPLKYYNIFKIQDVPKAKYEYDGHTPQEAKERMLEFLNYGYIGQDKVSLQPKTNIDFLESWKKSEKDLWGVKCPEKSGFEDIPKMNICTHPYHLPPMHLYIPPGKIYNHICPSCGHKTVIGSSHITC